MAVRRNGNQTVKLNNPPSIISSASIVGPKEGKGPLKLYFDNIIDDEMWGEKSWEKAESRFIRETFSKILSKGDKPPGDIDYVIAGDLLNQCVAVSYGLRETEIPFYGIYGACSTMGESIGLGAMMVDGGYADNLVCITSSHFCSAEKQFRFPLELGSQRPPSAQWTVTGSGGILISNNSTSPYITHVTTGKIVDMGIKDANNMGSAMAPAAADTILTHFKDTGLDVDFYDLIVTGDLGILGKSICIDMLKEQGCNIKDIYDDCGVLIFDSKKQDTHAGGSGCGCSAVVLAGYVMRELSADKLNNVLFVATGSLFSPTTIHQGESIPCIAHAVSIQNTLQ